MTAGRYTIIGENVHTSRIVLRKGKRFATRGGVDGVTFVSEDGKPGLLAISQTMRQSQAYDEGRIKHIALAVEAAMAGGAEARSGPRVPAAGGDGPATGRR